MVPVLLFTLLTGCIDSSFTMPSKEGAFKGKLSTGLKMPFRERVAILPGSDSRPPVPEYAVHKEQCDDLDHGGPNSGPDCVTDVIECGETIIGHTNGGVHRYDSRFYEKNFCTPYTTNHDGGDERIYQLTMPDGDYSAFVYLDTPCADLDMAGMRWSDLDTCPRADTMISQCEMWPDAYARDREYMRLVSQKGSTWLIVIEGKGDEEGAFALHVQCRPGLM
jgi:hypothetical protein